MMLLSNTPASPPLEKEVSYGLDDGWVMKWLLRIYTLQTTN
jgi:hypothetical protein